MNSNLLYDKWGSKVITGDAEAIKPNYAVFKNTVKAIQLLNKHIQRNSKIAIHCDVDLDGIGSGYILKRVLDYHNCTNQVLLINKDKIHGIQQKHVDFFKTYKIDLLIILDSSSNEIEYIQQFNCDVLVVDHHNVSQDKHDGKTLDGVHEFIIVNNTLENYNFSSEIEWLRNKNADAFKNIDSYEATSDMACGLTIYELLRIYCVCYSNEKLLENLMLFQWVAVTLFTDSVNLLNDRNQWYICNTVSSMQIERSLNIMLHEINRYKQHLSKSYINYEFAPLINKAIRAGAGSEAIDICLNRPQDITQLYKYAELQKQVLQTAIKDDEVYLDNFICKDVTNIDIGQNYSIENYCGVIATRLCGDLNKNTVAYKIKDGKAKGSFRGRYSDVDYRRFFEEYAPGIFAQGHKPAFGFEVDAELLPRIMSKIHEIEPKENEQYYITAGRIDSELRGINHIVDLDSFKKQGLLWRLAIGNSRVASRDELVIIVPLKDVVLSEIRGKVYEYDVLGIKCKSFSPLSSNLVQIYLEYTNNIDCYIKNI
ncbi:MAG: hypothetical protein J6A59_10615 [Lachnospiraceae bacterium]|nr:hypothetical protein [Lachnospiraceae bacterium]